LEHWAELNEGRTFPQSFEPLGHDKGTGKSWGVNLSRWHKKNGKKSQVKLVFAIGGIVNFLTLARHTRAVFVCIT